MRCLNRNQSSFFYALLQGETDVTDENSLYTGEKEISYSDPVEAKGNISPASGSAAAEVFGIDTAYSKILVMDDPNFPMTETSVLWIGKKAIVEGEVTPYNYIVKRKAVSRNYVVYVLVEVNVA